MKILLTFIFIGLFLAVVPFAMDSMSAFQFGSMPSSQGIFKTYDGGELWFSRSVLEFGGNVAKAGITDIVQDFNDHNIMYMGTERRGLYKSIQNGETWRKARDENRNLRDGAYIYRIAVNSKNGLEIFVAAFQNKRGYVFKSKDGGRSFASVYVVPLENQKVKSLEINSKNPNIIYIGTTAGGLLESLDGGESWKAIKWFDGSVEEILLNRRNSREIFAYILGKGLFKTVDGGKNWTDLTEKMKKYSGANRIEALAMDPANTKVIYAGSSYGLLKSVDGGQNWNPVGLIVPPDALPIRAIAFGKNSDTIYIGGGSRVYKSKDNGDHWSVKKLDTSRKISKISVDFSDAKIVFIGIYSDRK